MLKKISPSFMVYLLFLIPLSFLADILLSQNPFFPWTQPWLWINYPSFQPLHAAMILAIAIGGSGIFSIITLFCAKPLFLLNPFFTLLEKKLTHYMSVPIDHPFILKSLNMLKSFETRILSEFFVTRTEELLDRLCLSIEKIYPQTIQSRLVVTWIAVILFLIGMELL